MVAHQVIISSRYLRGALTQVYNCAKREESTFGGLPLLLVAASLTTVFVSEGKQATDFFFGPMYLSTRLFSGRCCKHTLIRSEGNYLLLDPSS